MLEEMLSDMPALHAPCESNEVSSFDESQMEAIDSGVDRASGDAGDNRDSNDMTMKVSNGGNEASKRKEKEFDKDIPKGGYLSAIPE